MAYTLAELLSPPSEAQVQTTLLSALTSAGFPVSSWPSGGAGRTLVQSFSRVLADGLQLVSYVARAGLLDLSPGTDPGSQGDWLSLFSASHYGIERKAAVFAVVKVRLTAASGSGPYTITPGGLWAKSPSGRRYNSTNDANVTISAGPSSVDVTFRAELAGVGGNVASGTGFALETPLPGVTAAAVETSVDSGTAMVVPGSDQERDAALRERCRTQWATIGLQHTIAAYEAIARRVPSVGEPTKNLVERTKVDDSNPRGPGTVNVWIAGSSGPLVTLEEAAVRAYMVARKSATADLQVQNAVAEPIWVIASLGMRTPSDAAVVEAIARVTALIDGLPIGGTLYLAAVIEELMAPAGVENVVVVSPPGDTVLGPNQVATVVSPEIWVEQL